MRSKDLAALLVRVEPTEIRGPLNQPIQGIAHDSRTIRPGFLFAALPGLQTDGHLFVEEALSRGAIAVVHSWPLDTYRPGVTYVRVKQSRQALSRISSDFFDNPSRELPVVGVTGTDGKSTTVWLVQQLLEAVGTPSGFISTVQMKAQDAVQKNPFRQSTPEAHDVQAILRRMRVSGKRVAVLEATSHGLSSKTARLQDVHFTAAVFTNITHEHLEFHGDFSQYRSDKANLFRSLSKGFGVVNIDDPNHTYFAQASTRPVFAYSLNDPQADLYASEIKTDTRGSSLVLHFGAHAAATRLNLPGRFNVRNLLAATLTVSKLLGVAIQQLIPAMPCLSATTGRMHSVACGQPFRVIVDFAHTPSSFEEVMTLVKAHTQGRLISVFVSAGERDTDKRPLQGAVASRHSDVVVLTDEDPRREDRVKILQDIGVGCRGMRERVDLFYEPDRRRAIELALGVARPGDSVLLLGKGHEETIITASGPMPWNEIREAESILGRLGYHPRVDP